jgi:hypothetical protein
MKTGGGERDSRPVAIVRTRCFANPNRGDKDAFARSESENNMAGNAVLQSNIVDIPSAPEFAANRFISAGFNGNALTLTFGTTHFLPVKMGEPMSDATQSVTYVTARVVLSAAAAAELVTNVKQMMEKLGLVKPGQQPTLQ